MNPVRKAAGKFSFLLVALGLAMAAWGESVVFKLDDALARDSAAIEATLRYQDYPPYIAHSKVPVATTKDTSVSSSQDRMRINSLASLGDLSRLWNVFASAQRGEHVVVSAIGGSITAAGGVSISYLSHVENWFKGAFPNASFSQVNAGLSSTGTYVAVHRVLEDLIVEKPDLVIVEFSVNDPVDPWCSQTMEGLIRRLLRLPNRPAVVMLFMMVDTGNNSEEVHKPVGQYYRLPMVSFRDGLWPEVQAGLIATSDFLFDSVHPNDAGHAYAGDFLIYLLDTARQQMPTLAGLPSLLPIPEPLFSDIYEDAGLLLTDSVEIERQGRWFRLPYNYHPSFGYGVFSDQPGGVLTATLYGTNFGVIVMHTGIGGRAAVQVDSGGIMEMDTFNPRGNFAYNMIAADSGLEAGIHNITLEHLPEPNAASSGNELWIYGFCSAGRKDLDFDGDGLPDGWEEDVGLLPFDPDGDNGPTGDPDGDGANNHDEWQHGSDPFCVDTDSDGYDDLFEITVGMLPYDPAAQNGPYGDYDGDGIPNGIETFLGLNLADSGDITDVTVVRNPLSLAFLVLLFAIAKLSMVRVRSRHH